jgi:hypothetical protein
MISGYQSEVHEKISGYLRGSASLADVENWVWSFLGDLEDSHDEDARNLVGAIGSLISEYSYGDISEDSLRRELAVAIGPFEDSWQNMATNCSEVPLMPVPGNSATNVFTRYYSDAA